MRAADAPTRRPLPDRVAVIIPTYNRAALLRRSIASVRRQTAAPLCDLVIVDDGSTDCTADVVREIAPEALYLRRQRGGPAAARNAGIEASRAPFIAFLDADDEWLPDKIERQLAAMHRWPNVLLVAGPTLRRYSDGRTVAPPTPALCTPDTPQNLLPALLRENFLSTPAVMVRRAGLTPAMRFPQGLRFAEDYVLWTRIAAAGPCVYLGEPLATAYMSEADSLSRDRDALWRGSVAAQRTIERELRGRPEHPLARLSSARVLAQARDHYLAQGKYAAALVCGTQSLWRCPRRRPVWEWTAPLAALARLVVGR